MKLDILTPEQIVFSGEVTMVTVPGTKGRFTILEHHAPLISSLRSGEISYQIGEQTFTIYSSGGFVEINNNNVSIAIESANK